MLAAERQEFILEKISKSGSVQVETLAELMGVSLMTVRRDLEKLKRDNIIERCHGGAIMKKEIPYSDKMVINQQAKTAIANRCITMIEPDDTIFLDAGTTTSCIARLIKHRNDLTVVTDDLEIAWILKDAAPDLLICGGRLQKSTGSILGMFANDMVQSLSIDISFLGAASIDTNFFACTPTMEKAELKRHVMKNSNTCYLAADDSKFKKQAMIRVHCLSEFTGVVTNRKFTKEEYQLIREKHVNIMRV